MEALIEAKNDSRSEVGDLFGDLNESITKTTHEKTWNTFKLWHIQMRFMKYKFMLWRKQYTFSVNTGKESKLIKISAGSPAGVVFGEMCGYLCGF